MSPPIFVIENFREKRNKKEEAEHFKKCLEDLPEGTLLVYSDRSSTGPGHSAYGYSIYKDKELMASGGKYLPGAEVFHAVIAGALRGLEVALEISGNPSIKVLLDNQEAAIGLINGRAGSTQLNVKSFLEKGKNWPGLVVRWIPGH